MDLNNLPQNPTGINGVTTKRPQRCSPGTFATGKGTTASIRYFFSERVCSYSAAEVAEALGVKPRQISKRLAELVKSGYLRHDGKEDGRLMFERTNPFECTDPVW